MIARAGVYLESVRFQHTIFALPFAFAAMLLAAGGWPGWSTVALITLAMIGARTGAMAANRLIDAQLDARNPRTVSRALPAGLMRQWEMLALAAAGFILLAIAAWQLNPTALALAPVAVLLVSAYPYFKRFTWLSHWFLGLADAIAVAGAWIGVAAGLDLAAVLLTLAMMFWIAGFDVIYACQDVEVDRREGLHSVPARFGIGPALWFSRVSHLIAVACMFALGLVAELSWVYWIGVAAAAGILVYEAALVRPNNLDNLQKAFFDMNGYVSMVFMVSVILHFTIAV
jgi:4-hydroxybenzoate polyprenyltransferase